jgi:ATP-binding cassette subfamily F protein uup
MPALSAQHLRRSYGPQVVLDDATFTLVREEKVGLIGANGAGKSTLAKILAGVETADAGTVSVRRGLTVRYLAQEPELEPEASARAVVEGALTAWKTATARHAEVTRQLDVEPARGATQSLRLRSPATDALVAEQAELADAIARLGGWNRGHEALGFLAQLGVRDAERPCGAQSGGDAASPSRSFSWRAPTSPFSTSPPTISTPRRPSGSRSISRASFAGPSSW